MDGRLDLDDLGQVVENATLLDGAPERDELSGSDGPTWAERTAPARTWVRRRRVPLAVIASAALLAGAGATAWQVRQPPPAATELDVTMSFASTSEGPFDYAEDGTVTVALRATPRRGGETARVLGLVGPGIAASRSTFLGVGTFRVRAVVDCSLDPSVITGVPAQRYLVAVATTDEYGRTLVGRLPMAGVTDALAPQVTTECTQRIADAGVLTRVTAARRDGDSLALTVSVSNGTEHRAVLETGPRSGTVDVSAQPVALPAGRDRFWDVRLTPTDCGDPRLDRVTADGTLVEGPAVAEPAFEAQVRLDSVPPGGSYGLASSFRLVRLGPAAAAWRAWVRASCVGREPVGADVIDASAPVPAPSAQDPGRFASTIRLRVVQPDAVVALAQARDPWNGVEPRITAPTDPDVPWSAVTGPGPRTTTVTVLWFFSCNGDLSPPEVAATAEYADGTRAPWRLRLDDAPLASVLRRTCPILLASDDELASWGWQTARLLPR